VDSGDQSDPEKSSRWSVIGLSVISVLVVLAIVASLVRLPYYKIAPGSVRDTIGLVEAPPARETEPQGQISFVTVSQTPDITLWDWLDAKLDRHSIIRHEDEVRGDQTTQEKRDEDQRRMRASKNSAVVLALDRLGFDLEITPLGIEVARVFECTGAEGTLGTGDVILALDGEATLDSASLLGELAEHEIGDTIVLRVERIDPENSARSISVEDVSLTLGSADAACLADDVRADEARPFMGIGIDPLFSEELPFDVGIETGNVGGPSAGLAFTLAIIDVLSEGELTNGLSVVATGTITREGSVGAVGGLQQKTAAAEDSGADIFLVPICCDNLVNVATGEPVPSNYEEALQYADDMQVVGVETLDDALEAIGALGGDVEPFLAVG